VVTADERDGARTHMFFFADELGDAVGPVAVERLRRVFEQVG
jgi:hypothetical protein